MGESGEWRCVYLTRWKIREVIMILSLFLLGWISVQGRVLSDRSAVNRERGRENYVSTPSQDRLGHVQVQSACPGEATEAGKSGWKARGRWRAPGGLIAIVSRYGDPEEIRNRSVSLE